MISTISYNEASLESGLNQLYAQNNQVIIFTPTMENDAVLNDFLRS